MRLSGASIGTDLPLIGTLSTYCLIISPRLSETLRYIVFPLDGLRLV